MQIQFWFFCSWRGERSDGIYARGYAQTLRFVMINFEYYCVGWFTTVGPITVRGSCEYVDS